VTSRSGSLDVIDEEDELTAHGLYRAEHRALRELYSVSRRLSGHWERLAERIGGPPATMLRRGAEAARELLGELAGRTSEHGLHGTPAAEGAGRGLGRTRNAGDLLLERNQAMRIAVLEIQHVTTLLGYLGQLAATVTVGQAFGGDHEAVTLHSGLIAAYAVERADVVVVTQGPGNLGTGTPWGFSGVAAGEAVNAVAALGGTPVGALRISGADERERHRGISHHSRTAYGRVALARARIVVPELGVALAAEVEADLVESGIAERHELVRVPAAGLLESLRASGAALSTMGRGLDEDPAYFVAAAAAGRYAAGQAAPTAL